MKKIVIGLIVFIMFIGAVSANETNKQGWLSWGASWVNPYSYVKKDVVNDSSKNPSDESSVDQEVDENKFYDASADLSIKDKSELAELKDDKESKEERRKIEARKKMLEKLVGFMNKTSETLSKNINDIKSPSYKETCKEDSGETAEDLACKEAYANFYDKDKLKFDIYFGYADSKQTDQVFDAYQRKAMLDTLLKPCPKDSELFACGFKQSPKKEGVEYDGYTIAKFLKGPDGKKRRVTLKLRSSSLSDDHEENYYERYDEQIAKADEREQEFLDSMKGSDLVFYLGHSRIGTDTGFKPLPKYSMDWFKAGIFREGRSKLYNTLSSAENKPKMIGMFSCHSKDYFGRLLRQAAPDTGLLLTDASLNGGDALRNALASINSVLGMKCQKSFNESIKSTTVDELQDNPPTKVLGFFKGNEDIQRTDSYSWYDSISESVWQTKNFLTRGGSHN